MTGEAENGTDSLSAVPAGFGPRALADLDEDPDLRSLLGAHAPIGAPALTCWPFGADEFQPYVLPLTRPRAAPAATAAGRFGESWLERVLTNLDLAEGQRRRHLLTEHAARCLALLLAPGPQRGDGLPGWWPDTPRNHAQTQSFAYGLAKRGPVVARWIYAAAVADLRHRPGDFERGSLRRLEEFKGTDFAGTADDAWARHWIAVGSAAGLNVSSRRPAQVFHPLRRGMSPAKGGWRKTGSTRHVEPRKAREARDRGRMLLAHIGVWPWTHAPEGELRKDWRTDPAFIRPLEDWYFTGCAELEARLPMAVRVRATLLRGSRPERLHSDAAPRAGTPFRSGSE